MTILVVPQFNIVKFNIMNPKHSTNYLKNLEAFVILMVVLILAFHKLNVNSQYYYIKSKVSVIQFFNKFHQQANHLIKVMSLFFNMVKRSLVGMVKQPIVWKR